MSCISRVKCMQERIQDYHKILRKTDCICSGPVPIVWMIHPCLIEKWAKLFCCCLKRALCINTKDSISHVIWIWQIRWRSEKVTGFMPHIWTPSNMACIRVQLSTEPGSRASLGGRRAFARGARTISTTISPKVVTGDGGMRLNMSSRDPTH